MKRQEPYIISYKMFRKLAIKALKVTAEKLPEYFPTVEEIDFLLESKEFVQVQLKEEVYKYLIMCIAYGFARDEQWHEKNPGKREKNADNFILYLTTPLKDVIEPHVNIWRNDELYLEKENRQAAFEYMQSIILDPLMYLVIKDT